jgi:quercetin dioxygenase-like cupin family protein
MSETWPKCWGRNTEIFKNNTCSVNLLELVKGGVCSWHFHRHKHNNFHLISGRVLIKTEFNETILEPNNSVLVTAPLKHQFEALEDSLMIEVMYVEYMPTDIIRETQGFLKKPEEELKNE